MEDLQQVKENAKRVALVTGSATGIGANLVVDLVSEGYHVIITGRNLKSLQTVAEKCNSTRVSIFVADLDDMHQVDALIQFVKDTFGTLHLLINNACWRGEANILSEHMDFERVLHLNVKVPMYLIHKCLIPLRPKGPEKASVINMTSIAGQLVVALQLYSISKACLAEMSRQLGNLSDELGIYSIAVAPGPILTDERPFHREAGMKTLLGRAGSTQEVCDLVVFAAKHPHLFNGLELTIDGGLTSKKV